MPTFWRCGRRFSLFSFSITFCFWLASCCFKFTKNSNEVKDSLKNKSSNNYVNSLPTYPSHKTTYFSSIWCGHFCVLFCHVQEMQSHFLNKITVASWAFKILQKQDNTIILYTEIYIIEPIHAKILMFSLSTSADEVLLLELTCCHNQQLPYSYRHCGCKFNVTSMTKEPIWRSEFRNGCHSADK